MGRSRRSEMGKCKDCEFWRDTEDCNGLNIGRCGYVVSRYDAFDFVKFPDGRMGYELKPEYKDRLAFTQDPSDFYARLVTLPDFGCVAFKEKL